MPYDPKKDGERRKKENETTREKMGLLVTAARRALQLERQDEISRLEAEAQEKEKNKPKSLLEHYI